MRKMKLTASQRRKIRTMLRETHDVRLYRRLLAVLEFDRGKSVSAIAELLGVSCQSVYNWITRFEHGGDGCELSDAPRSGRPTRAGEVVNVSLKTLLILSPEWFGYCATHWTVPLLKNQLRQNTGEEYSADTIRRRLHELGYVWKRPRYVLAPDPEREKKRQIRRALSGLPRRSVVLVEDETDLLLFPPLRAMWSPRGQAAQVMLSGWNARRVVFGCMNLATGHRLFQNRRHQRACDFQAFLLQIRQRYRGWHVTLLLDSDSSHTAKASQTTAAQLGVQLLWLPKRGPELNPMDTLWGQGKDVISANKQYTNIDQQAESFITHLTSLSNREALKTSGVLSSHFWLRRVLSKNFCEPA